MREIHKKISPEYFEVILSGQKTFEWRVNDFEKHGAQAISLLDEDKWFAGFILFSFRFSLCRASWSVVILGGSRARPCQLARGGA